MLAEAFPVAVLVALGLVGGLIATLALAVALKAARGLLREEPAYFTASLPRFSVKVGRRIARKSLGRFRAVFGVSPRATPQELVGTRAILPVSDTGEKYPGSAELATSEEVPAAILPNVTAKDKRADSSFHAKIEELDRQAYELMNVVGDHARARDTLSERTYLQDEYARFLGFDPSEVLLLNGEWLVAIGHMALLDYWVKMIRLGWGPWKHLVLVAAPWSIANRAYLEYWKNHFNAIITAPDLCKALQPYTHAAGHTVSTVVSLPDGSRDLLVYTSGKIQAAWEQENRHPLLELTEEDRKRGLERLREMGLPSDAWYVCIHARTSGFYEEWRASHQSHRDADIENYRDAIAEITNRGGWVIRVGDSSMKPMFQAPRVIDYASSSYKSDWMDVFLLASCRFFLGGTSGLSHVPATFGVPTAFVNWICPILPFYSRRDRFIPKLLWHEREQRLLTFPEQFRQEMCAASHARPFLDRHGLREMDNTPDEIRELVREMLELTDGGSPDLPEDERLQAVFASCAITAGRGKVMRVGKAFLHAHQDLLLDEGQVFRRAG